MNGDREKIKDKLSTLPARPGVYVMKDSGGEIIYVGKAASLRNRVRSYFQQSRLGHPRLDRLVGRISDFDYIVTDTEVEALILEANLIKEHKPRYNVNLKDDKKYPYIAVTRELFPRIYVTRRMKKDAARYFGPYTDVKAMRRTLETLRRIFPVRNCRWDLPQHRPPRACLSFHIKRCPAPCQGAISSDEYSRLVQQAELFLMGRSDTLAKILRQKMEEASRQLKYELAAEFRDRLADLESVTTRQKVVTTSGEDWDIIAIARENDDAMGVVMEVRDGKLLDRKNYHLSGVRGSPDDEVVSAFVRQFYVGATTVPREIHLPCHIDEEETICGWLSQRRGQKVIIRVPRRGDKAKLVGMARKNAELLLTEWRLKRERVERQIPHAVAALQKDLKLNMPPRRIEAIDVSNFGGTDAVASVICFSDGRPRKSEYRRFKISTVEGQDDFAMMKEVVYRRFRRLTEEGRDLPDLLLVDGGRGHLSSALAALKELGITDQPVISLAKRLDEVFVPGIPDPQMIPKASSTLRLLQHIRDEAHRFAVSYHRKLRGKRASLSVLDRIPGIGQVRKMILLRRFGSVKAIAEASVEEIAAVEGIGPTIARTIKEQLEPKSGKLNTKNTESGLNRIDPKGKQ